jgi:hypothetical protein
MFFDQHGTPVREPLLASGVPVPSKVWDFSMRLHLFVLLALTPLCGCNSKPYSVAQVSGRVTLDNKPLSKASVTFVPMATQENQAPGPTAWGPTDAEGRYKLAFDPQTPGTVVGKCRVYISGVLPDQAATNADRDTGGSRKLPKDPVPEKYNKKTELVYEVPASGTDQANFDLKSQ